MVVVVVVVEVVVVGSRVVVVVGRGVVVVVVVSRVVVVVVAPQVWHLTNSHQMAAVKMLLETARVMVRVPQVRLASLALAHALCMQQVRSHTHIKSDSGSTSLVEVETVLNLRMPLLVIKHPATVFDDVTVVGVVSPRPM